MCKVSSTKIAVVVPQQHQLELGVRSLRAKKLEDLRPLRKLIPIGGIMWMASCR
jgi:hypothetical protein